MADTIRNIKSYENDIQTAIDSLPSTGGEVYVPAGSYTISAQITFADNVTMRGAGESTVFVFGAGLATDVFFVNDRKNVHFKDFKIDANKASAGISHGILFIGSCIDCSARGIYTENGSTAMLECRNGGSRITFDNCTCINNEGDPLLIRSGSDCIVTNCHIDNVHTQAGANGIGVFTSVGDDYVCQGITVNNNTVNNALVYGINVENAIDVTVSGNIVNNCKSAGLAVIGSSKRVTMSDNVAKGNANGIYVGNASSGTGSFVSLCNNIVTGNHAHGIQVFLSGNVTIVGNTVAENTGSVTTNGIYLNRANQCIVSGNNIFGNQDYGFYTWHGSYNLITSNMVTGNGDNGIATAGGSADYNLIANNISVNNTDTGITTVGSNNQIAYNITD